MNVTGGASADDVSTRRDSPALSVVIAAFDAQETLGQQLDALAGQDVSFAFEVLVCDNGSRDATVDLVHRYQQTYPWLRLVDASARRGPSAARNIGAGHARAPLLAFCDADDVVAEGWLAGMHTALQHDEFVTGAWEGERLNARRGASVSWTTNPLVTKPFLPWLPGTGAGTMGIRKSVFEEAHGFDESLRTGEDVDLAWRVQLAGHRLRLHPEIVLHVRKRDGLRATYRQAYAYGAGDRQLRHRWADVAAAFRAQAARTVESSADAPTDVGLATRAPRVSRIVAVPARVAVAVRNKVRRGRSGIAETVWRIGERLGSRFGPVDEHAPRIPVPSTLPDAR